MLAIFASPPIMFAFRHSSTPCANRGHCANPAKSPVGELADAVEQANRHASVAPPDLTTSLTPLIAHRALCRFVAAFVRCLPFVVFAFFALCFGQPVVVIGVVWCSSAPFCALNAVGIFKVLWQRLPFAASAEYGPCGSFSSKL